MRTIFIVADSTNRRYLSAYGNEWVKTPHIDRLGESGIIFDNHWVGSAPCMPARRDMMTGRLNFLERNWGGIEAFDHTLPQILQDNGIFTHILTDHSNYIEIGGENYCQAFNTWECFRGQERDRWMSQVNAGKSSTAENCIGQNEIQYNLNKLNFTEEKDYPTPKTFQAAADWLDRNKEEDDFFLWVETFDPHEPFDTPDHYLEQYGDDYAGPAYNWPDYGPSGETEEAVDHIRKRYAANLTMTDAWIGKLFDIMDKNGMWEDTMVIFTTDHGFMLGEHNFMGKNYMPAFNEVYHIPLIIHDPRNAKGPKRIGALTQNIDLFPTVLEAHGIREGALNDIHGKSLWGLMEDRTEKVREFALYGIFGKSVNITDGRHTYMRAPAGEDNKPLNIYASLPTTLRQYYGIERISDLSKIDMGRFLPWTDYPVYKLPAEITRFTNESQEFQGRGPYNTQNMLFNIEEDYPQSLPIDDPELEEYFIRQLRKTMTEHDSPAEQFLRLGME